MIILISIFFAGQLYAGEGSLQLPKQLEGAEVVDKTGAKVPLDIHLHRHDGVDIVSKDLFANGKGLPTILTLGYFECPMLCSLVLNGLVEGLKKSDVVLGKDYRIASVSINPDDDTQLAFDKRHNYLNALNASSTRSSEGEPISSSAWDFFTAAAGESKRLADAVGFGYKKDAAGGDYAHGAAVFFISPDGVLTRTLWGISFAAKDVKRALMESSQGKIGSPIERILLSCFHFDPDSRKYGIYVFGVMRLGGVITIIVLLCMLLYYWKVVERRRNIYAELK